MIFSNIIIRSGWVNGGGALIESYDTNNIDFGLYVRDCVNYAIVNGDYSGGLIGRVYLSGLSGSILFENCFNYGTINGVKTGGIVGYSYGYHRSVYEGNFTNCINYGTLNGDYAHTLYAVSEQNGGGTN